MGRCTDSLVALCRNGWIRSVGVIAPIFTYVGFMSDGFQYWTWLSTNWCWLVNLSKSPFFGWGVAAVLVVMMARGIHQVAKGIGPAFQREMAIPLAILQYHERATEVEQLRQAIAAQRQTLEQNRRWLKDPSNVPEFSGLRHPAHLFRPIAETLDLNLIPIPQHQFQFPSPMNSWPPNADKGHAIDQIEHYMNELDRVVRLQEDWVKRDAKHIKQAIARLPKRA